MYFRSVGTLVGIIIGSIMGLVIIITIIVAICATCTKTAGTRGRVIHPMNPPGGLAVLHWSTNGKYTNVWFTRACTHTNTQTQRIYIYISNLVRYTYFHCFLNPECQHIFGKQTGYIFQSPKTIKTWTTKHYASLNQWYNTE